MKISQREAQRLRKRVQELEAMEMKRRSAWTADYPGGVNIVNVCGEATQRAIIGTARKLGHAVVVTCNGDALQFYALPLRS